jgi:cytochrome c2
MSWTRFGSIAVLLALVVPAAAVDIDDLKPGLVAVYRDSAKNPVEIVRLEPAIGLNWKTAESPHPRLAADGGSVAWQGYLNILRAGKYSFAANLRGQVQVTIAGKEVLAGDSKGGAKLLVRGRDTELPSGPQPLSVKFSRAGSGAAQLELLWQASYFRSEPIPYDHLFHDPGKLPARFAVDRAAERGRFFFEEYGCLKCHQADARDQLAAGLQSRIGPDLSQVGGRATPGWLHHWLSDPQLFRPGAAMPRMFADDEAGKVELYAVSRYLASRIGPGGKPPAKPANPKELEAAVKRGRELFGSAGCIACHADKPRSEPAGMYGDPRNYPLGALGNKTTADALAAYLGNPLAIDPSGRMPDMLLNPREALDLAWFLCEVKDNRIPAELPAAPADDRRRAAYQRLRPAADELDAFQKLRPDDQWLALGQRLVIAKGCTNCHNITSAGKPLPVQAAQANFAALRGKPSTAGCLADEPAQRRSAPLFSMNDADRKAIRTFLQEAGSGAGSPAPMHAARLTLHRFNCFACHSRNGKGGLTPQIVEDLRRFEKAENAEAVMPPPLTGVGHKLRTPWLRQVLVQKARARPWMALRMPHFGEANVGQLVEALAYLEGSEPDDQVHQAPLTAASIDAGKHLVGKNAFGCISCHDLAGIPNTGTRGPDRRT